MTPRFLAQVIVWIIIVLAYTGDTGESGLGGKMIYFSFENTDFEMSMGIYVETVSSKIGLQIQKTGESLGLETLTMGVSETTKDECRERESNKAEINS